MNYKQRESYFMEEKVRKEEIETGIEEIIGESEKMLEVKKTIEQIAPTDISVMILGESGTGKEVVAKTIHQKSKRKNEQIVSVNCGAIPEGILESELFGHEKGAFTGAVSKRKGYFEIADKGTIFLDEIGEMSLYTQVKLLRVLEEREFIRVGGTVPIKVDTRVIASTNKNLEVAVNKNEFRRDLYYRLKAVTIHMPPLRERKDDIELLANAFLEEYYRKINIPFKGIAPDAMNILKRYSWPGNVRELKNLLESLVILSKGGVIKVSELPENIKKDTEFDKAYPVPLNVSAEKAERELIYRTLLTLASEVAEIKKILIEDRENVPGFIPSEKYTQKEHIIGEEIPYKEEGSEGEISLKNNERELIKRALAKHNGNRKRAANELGISERTLYRKIKSVC